MSSDAHTDVDLAVLQTLTREYVKCARKQPQESSLAQSDLKVVVRVVLGYSASQSLCMHLAMSAQSL